MKRSSFGRSCCATGRASAHARKNSWRNRWFRTSRKRGNASSRIKYQPYTSSVVASGRAPCGPRNPRNFVKMRSRPSGSGSTLLRLEAGKSMYGSWPSITYSSRNAALSPIRGRSACVRSSLRIESKKSNRYGSSAASLTKVTAALVYQACVPGAPSELAPRADPRRPAHDLAALNRSDNGLRKVVERGVFRKEAIEDCAEQEHAATLECLLVDRHGDLEAARGRASA